MIRVAHLSDLHVTEGPRLEDQAADLARVGQGILDARPDLILLTGDYYGRTVPHRPTPRERAVLEPWIVRFADYAPVVLLEGNHDHGEALGLSSLLGGSYPIKVINGAEFHVVHTEQGEVDLYGLAYPTKRWLLARAGAMGIADSTASIEASLAGIMRMWAQQISARRRRFLNRPMIAMAHATIRGSRLAGGEVLATQEVEITPDLLLGMDVDYGALGHIHERQDLAPRWWYVGDPWAVDFGERGDKGWHLVTIGQDLEPIGPGGKDPRSKSYHEMGRNSVHVEFRPSGSRAWITLDYRWAIDRETGVGRWVSRPTAAECELAAGAEVRMRLVVPDQAVAGCPWDSEVERIRALGAHRVTVERSIEATQRVRAPELAAAVDLAGKVRAYWSTLATPPDPIEQEAALAALQELEQLDDDAIEDLTQELLPS